MTNRDESFAPRADRARFANLRRVAQRQQELIQQLIARVNSQGEALSQLKKLLAERSAR
jgi:hypothetical protein